MGGWCLPYLLCSLVLRRKSLISAKLPQIGFACLAHSKSFQSAQMRQGQCRRIGVSAWRPSGGTSITGLFSDQCACLSPLSLFLMLLKRVSQQARSEPTKNEEFLPWPFYKALVAVQWRSCWLCLHHHGKKEWEFFRRHVPEYIKCYIFFFNYLSLLFYRKV